MIEKPSLLEVICKRVDLRRRGREYVGLCPFHDERHPSFSVNPDKGLFHCFGCGESGDVVDFIQKLDGLSFPDACRALGMETARGKSPAPTLTPKRKRAAENAAAWVNEQRAKFNVLIADALEQRDLADEIGDSELGEIFDRELIIFRGFYDSLAYPVGALEVLAARESIERITEGAQSTL